jgi:hypothetical protein
VLINHDFSKSVPGSTDVHVALRGRIQRDNFKDYEWEDDQHIDSIVRLFPDIILAVVDTGIPEKGFECCSFDDKDVITYIDEDGVNLPINKKIIRITYTGNHFLSVISHSDLASGRIRAAFPVESQTLTSPN